MVQIPNMPIVFVDVVPQSPSKPLPSLEDEMFRPCEEIFPQWLTARIILTEFVEKIGGWRITHDPVTRACNVALELGFPIDAMPPEDRYTVEAIVFRTIEEFLPDFSCCLGAPGTEATEAQMLCEINHRQHEIESACGRDVASLLKFRLGLTPYV